MLGLHNEMARCEIGFEHSDLAGPNISKSSPSRNPATMDKDKTKTCHTRREETSQTHAMTMAFLRSNHTRSPCRSPPPGENRHVDAPVCKLVANAITLTTDTWAKKGKRLAYVHSSSPASAAAYSERSLCAHTKLDILTPLFDLLVHTILLVLKLLGRQVTANPSGILVLELLGH